MRPPVVLVHPLAEENVELLKRERPAGEHAQEALPHHPVQLLHHALALRRVWLRVDEPQSYRRAAVCDPVVPVAAAVVHVERVRQPTALERAPHAVHEALRRLVPVPRRAADQPALLPMQMNSFAVTMRPSASTTFGPCMQSLCHMSFIRGALYALRSA